VLNLDELVPTISRVIFRYDVAYAHQAGKNIHFRIANLMRSVMLIDIIASGLRERLQPFHIDVSYSETPIRLDPQLLPLPSDQSGNDGVDDRECTIVYVGGESLGLTNLLLTHAKHNVRLFLYLVPIVSDTWTI
jgi:hypothetical protein